MAVIEVVEPGLLATIQDLGRPGYGAIGVSACGAADPIALRAGNRLVGNPENAAAIEVTLAGGRFRFPQGAVIALAGAPFDCSTEFWLTHHLRPEAEVSIAGSQSGARCYLCVRGGIDVPLVLGSASTHLTSRLGGVDGRPLQRGQILQIGEPSGVPSRSRVRRRALELITPRKQLRVTPGPQPLTLPDDEYEVTAQSNRTGIRLLGPPLSLPASNMITEGVSLGAVQVPSSGQPIILFVDAQTTGGYPICANVIAADLPSLGQLRPRDRITFERVTFEHARELYIAQERLLQSDELLW